MTRPLGSVSPMLRSAALAAAFAGLYFLTTQLSGWIVGDPAVLWPASGVYLGVMLVAPRHSWPVLACGAAIGSLVTYLHSGTSLELSIAFAIPSSAEGLLAAVLVERIAGTRFTLAGMRELFAFVVGGAVVANGLVALSVGAVAVRSFDASFTESWLRWWSADALGMIAVVPILTVRSRGLRTAALAGLGVSLVATHVTAEVFAIQGFLAVLLLGSLAYAAAARDRERVRDDLGRSKEELERRRTAADRASHKLGGSAARLERAGRRIAQLTAEVAARRAEGDEATRRLDDATCREERLTADLRDSHAARERTERSLADARDELSRVSDENGSLEEELSRAGAQLADARDELSRVSDENGSLEEELSRAGAQLADARDELSRAGNENGSLEEELSRAGTQNAALEEAMSRVSARYSALKEDLSRVSAGNGALEEALSRASTQNGALEEELSRVSAQAGALEEELSRARTELAEAVGERDRAEQELVAAPRDDVRSELEQTQRAHAQAEQALEQARALLLEERAQREEALDEITATLARTEAERRLLAEHATELIARYDERGTCLYASPAARRLLGYEPDELVARPGAELLHPDDRHMLARARAARAESTFQARLRRKTGEYIWVEVRLRPVLAHDGDRVVAVTTTIREISRNRDLAAA
jgi:PAS domain S-box-containing protein